MFRFFSFTTLVFLLAVSKGFQYEINLTDENPSLSLKIICKPPSKNLNLNDNLQVLWHGTQFGDYEKQKLSQKFLANIFMPNITINSSKKYVCYLVAPRSFFRSLIAQKNRILRDDAVASIPMENGVCPPGHRIDQDRCFPCFPGSYTSGQETECFLCPKDFYMNKKAADSCWPCPEGKKTLSLGADSEESCVYLDESGHAEIKQSPPWILIYSLIGFILLCVWIIIIFFLIRYWKEWKGRSADEPDISQDRKDSMAKERLLPEDHASETIPSDTDKEEPIYAEIDDYGDTYEEPIRPSDLPLYLDLEAPPLPPKRKETERRTTSIYKPPAEKFSEDQYESPIKKSTVEQIKGSSLSQEQYEVPIQRSSDAQYEVPIRRHSDHSYIELLDSSEDHVYSEIRSEDEINSTENDNENKVFSYNSAGFDPVRSSTERPRQIPSQTVSYGAKEDRKYSLENNRRHSTGYIR